jgi:hypothetical protein
MRSAPGNSYRCYADDKEGDHFWIHTKTMDARLHKKDGDFRIPSHREKPVQATRPEEIQVFSTNQTAGRYHRGIFIQLSIEC